MPLLPDIIGVRADVSQMVTISSRGFASTTGRLKGVAAAARFRMLAALGRLDDPGAALPYEDVDGNDWWPDEPRAPSTYTIYRRHRAASTHWRRTWAEHLDGYSVQYRFAIEVGFNPPGGVHTRSRTGSGSAPGLPTRPWAAASSCMARATD